MPFILGTNSIKDTGFDVANSLRFNSGSDDSLSINAGTSSNRRTFTFSTWVKTSAIESDRQELLGAGGSSDQNHILIEQQGGLSIWHYTGSFTTKITTSALLRDPSAWMHLVCAVDTTQGTESNRIKLYINGVQQTSLSETNYPDQNFDFDFMQNGTTTYIGRRGHEAGYRLNSYLAETVFIDGQQLAADQFGEFDSDSPTIWKPIDVSGLTFGNAGFYLDYEDSSALGNDAAGSNNFTVNNLTAIDQSIDTCTNNFATANPLLNTTPTYSEGNLNIVTTNGNNLGGVSTIGVNTGKWYAEFKVIANDTCAMLGIDSDPSESARLDASTEAFPGRYATGYGYYFNGNKFNNNSDSSYGNTYTTNDIIGIALDLDNNKLYFSKNGTFQNSGDPTSGATGTGAISITDPSSQPTGNYFFVTGDGSRSRASTFSCNFGSPSFSISSGNADANGFGNFEYAVPSGYYSLNTKNLSEFG